MASLLKAELATQVAGATAGKPLLSQLLAAGARTTSSFQPPAAEANPGRPVQRHSQHRFMDPLAKAILYQHRREVLKLRRSSLMRGRQSQHCPKNHWRRAVQDAGPAGEKKKLDFAEWYNVPSTMNQQYPTARQQRERHE